MSYKTILIHIDESRHLDQRVEVAARIALHEKALLIGLAVTGISRLLRSPAIDSEDGGRIEPYRAEYLASLRQRASLALQRFEALARRIGVVSYEKRLIDDEAADAVSAQGRYADLIILGQSATDNPSVMTNVDFPEYVILNSECPVLIVPYAGRVSSIGERVLIAWNGSMAASRAARNAMPFLRQASQVHLAIIDAPLHLAPQCEESAAEMAAYLLRHGIKLVSHRTAADNAGQALLALAAELDADLLVTGCVAHPRWRGVLLGGATRTVLESATIPVLMSH